MVMFLLFPVFAFGALAIWTASAIRGGSVRVVPPPQTAAILGFALSYGLGLLLVSLDPYIEDNGVRDFVPWPFRWIWAAELAGWIAILLVPTTLILEYFFRRTRSAGRSTK